MKLHRLCFNSFGILRNQVMEAIQPGLVIIAGANRAGKTTMMTALRYLGYGLPKKDFIPPPLVGQHDYNADLELEDKSRYNIRILGNSKPKVSPLGTYPQREVEDIFHNIDAFTYRQIFTISLDELRHIPRGLANGEEQRLQVVLLGGGWGDALRLARLEKEFGQRARNIGGTNGSKNVFKFRPYHEIIQEGIAARNEANKELESYYAKLEKLSELQTEIIPHLEKELSKEQAELEVLEIIKDHYGQYEEMLLLESKLEQEEALFKTYPADGLQQGMGLQEKYLACLEEYEKLWRNFAFTTGIEEPHLFLRNKELLHSYERNLSGWREKVVAYRERKQRHQGEERDLKDRLARLYAPWGDDLSILGKIATDGVQKESLRQDVEKYKKTVEQVRALASRKIPTQDNLDLRKKEMMQFVEKHKVGNQRKLPVITTFGIVAVLVIALFSPLSALAAGFILGAAIYVHAQSLRLQKQEYINLLSPLENSIKELEKELIFLEGEEKYCRESLKTLENELDNTVVLLQLPSNIPYSQLADFHREVENLRNGYGPWLDEGKRLAELQRDLQGVFTAITCTLKSLKLPVSAGDGDFSSAPAIFAAVEEAVSHLALARELEITKIEKENLEKKIIALLQRENPAAQISLDIPPPELTRKLSSFLVRGEHYRELKNKEEARSAIHSNLETSLHIGRRKEILCKDKAEQSPLSAYAKLFNAYSSAGDIEAKHEKTAAKIKEYERQRLERMREVAILEKEIRDLAADEKLQAAQRTIIGARNCLETLAEEYATYRLAEFLVREAHKVFVEGSKGSVLNAASKIFTEITAGDYEKIDLPTTPPDTNLVPEFAVLQVNKKDTQATHHLSRATREQLFLSVRLGRIRNMKPLPVILDDSLVNFDPRHCKQTARLIANQAETHQVFVLTCHPEFIHHLQQYAPTTQCWGLDKGKIIGPFSDHEEAARLLNP